MLARATPKAQKIISLASDHAACQSCAIVSIDHLFVGIFAEGTNIAAKTLILCGTSPEKAYSVFSYKPAQKQKEVHEREVTYSQELLRVFDASWHEAEMLNHNYIGSEHILLSLTACEEATNSFELLGLSKMKVRSKILKLLGVPS